MGGGERVLDFDQILAYQILAKLKQMGGGWGGGREKAVLGLTFDQILAYQY